MVEVNLLGAMTATEVFLEQLRDGGGDLVNVSSVAGGNAREGSSVYNATKWGLNGWSEALRVCPMLLGRRGHPERAADELEGEAGGLLAVDEGGHLRGVPSSSLAKNTLADLRIALAWRSSRFSRSSASRRSRSSPVRRSWRWPASASAWRTQPRSDSAPTPRSAATCAIGRPDSNTKRTARSRSSGEYFGGRASNQRLLFLQDMILVSKPPPNPVRLRPHLVHRAQVATDPKARVIVAVGPSARPGTRATPFRR